MEEDSNINLHFVIYCWICVIYSRLAGHQPFFAAWNVESTSLSVWFMPRQEAIHYIETSWVPTNPNGEVPLASHQSGGIIDDTKNSVTDFGLYINHERSHSRAKQVMSRSRSCSPLGLAFTACATLAVSRRGEGVSCGTTTKCNTKEPAAESNCEYVSVSKKTKVTEGSTRQS
jgi:hypothetical protein